jgi:hypothetical protein
VNPKSLKCGMVMQVRRLSGFCDGGQVDGTDLRDERSYVIRIDENVEWGGSVVEWRSVGEESITEF